MIPALRRRYNDAFTRDAYEAYQERLAAECGFPIVFRLAETPVFLPPALRDEMVRSAQEIWAELSTPENLARSLEAVPPGVGRPRMRSPAALRAGRLRRRARGRPPRAEADRAAGVPLPLRIPALPVAAPAGRSRPAGRARVPPSPASTRTDTCAKSDARSWARNRRERRPPRHRPASSEDRRRLLLHGKALGRAGRGSSPAHQARTRALVRTGRDSHADPPDLQPGDLRRARGQAIDLPFDFREPLDVAWAGHPNWYFRWSKHSLPALRHPAAPEARFLSDLRDVPGDLGSWVLKPLFSFAGSGVKVDVTPEDIASVPRR